MFGIDPQTLANLAGLQSQIQTFIETQTQAMKDVQARLDRIENLLTEISGHE